MPEEADEAGLIGSYRQTVLIVFQRGYGDVLRSAGVQGMFVYLVVNVDMIGGHAGSGRGI
jgi:hypothetical protein